jgi:SAM-dependent methyltransferase
MTGPLRDTPTDLRPNNRYLLAKIRQFAAKGRSLDFGCGPGALVAAARAEGVQAYGAETFYDGRRPEDIELAHAWGLDEDSLREIKGGIIDFPDSFFDVVVHNQVFEHVVDLNGACAEIFRVLKPGGVMVGIFPTRGVIKEPHLGLPCVHWFPPGKARSAWARLTRSLGFGYDFWGEGEAWFERPLKFIDEKTSFRTRRQIAKIMRPYFDVKWTETEWLAFRVPKFKGILSVPGAGFFAQKVCRVGAGPIIEATTRKKA